MSTFRVEVVPVVLEPHPDADSLSIVKVRGFTVCVKTFDWVDRKIGVYIPPDSIVPDTDQFKFLNTSRRIKVRKLRGIISMGLLVPAPEGSKLGDNVAELMGITHYETPIELSTSGEARGYSDFYLPIYDVENYYNYPDVLREGELVQVTEKCKDAIIENLVYDLCFRCPILNCVPDKDGNILCTSSLYRKDWALAWKVWFDSDMSDLPKLLL